MVLLAAYRTRAIVATVAIFLVCASLEVALLPFVDGRYVLLGGIVGGAFWGAVGIRKVSTAKAEPGIDAAGSRPPWYFWVIFWGFIALARSNAALALGAPTAALLAMGLAHPIPVVLARRRLRRDPDLALNVWVATYGLYRKRFLEIPEAYRGVAVNPTPKSQGC